ncbi:hypothetical protein F5Y14DRAFT_51029 [Nemania sp. NC0429]|nr:hypothetical protein F5Y14DRAFT_51029 [Nemania sp. NC0429]
MDRLPLELLQRVLMHLDLQDLPNVALSCPCLFNAFKGAEEIITGQVLFGQINYDVLPEAILVNKTRNLPKSSVGEQLEFVKVHLDHREPPPTQWNLADALPLAQFHEKVNYLATRAADDALTRQPRLLATGEPPTCAEICRFERALYRFQLYCNILGPLFYSAVLADYHELEDLFFEYFCTWENEQLACIHEHLVREVSIPFNYLVEHDITWGYMAIPYISEHCSDYAQAILSHGIDKIYQLVQPLSTYAEWHALLSCGEESYNEPRFMTGFLGGGLERGASPLIPPWVPLCEMDAEYKEFVINQPFYQDPDPGPVSMWEWIYREFGPGELVADPRMIVHRQWAFPFWDHSRLEAAGLLGDPMIPGPWCISELELAQFDMEDHLASLAETRRARRKIWEAGGFGWYSHQDSSQVKWRVYEHERPTRLAQLQSLGEAKNFVKATAGLLI